MSVRASGRWSNLTLAARTALTSAAFGLILVAGAIAVGWWALSRQLDDRSAAELHGRREMLVHVLSEVPTVDSIPHPLRDLMIGHDELHLALVDPDTGTSIASFSAVARQSVEVLDAIALSDSAVGMWTANDATHLSSVRGTAPLANGQGVRYYLSLDRRPDVRLLEGFLKATLVGVPVLLLLVGLGAWLIARTGLAPLKRFNRLAASIGATSLSRRVPSSGLPRELADLAREFNGMLARIDQGYQRLQEFSGNLAHEMRTPVATLLGRTQVALSQTRTAGQLQDVLEGNVEELERISRLIADMLFIARADHNDSPLQREVIDLGDEARRVADYLSLIADEQGVTVEVGGNATIDADRLLVQRAITNLLSNAVRHARTGSTINVAISMEASGTALAVSNVGERIPDDQLDRIFDRFYRLDHARARRDGGAGLGLAIVRSIMAAHAGGVRAHSEPGGLTVFTLTFPRRLNTAESTQ